MDSYTLIAKLRRARRKNAISAGSQALYYELMAINNEEDWAEQFKCVATELCGVLRISEKTLSVYKNELIMAGLLGYISGKNKREPSTYCLFGSSLGSSNGGSLGSKIEHHTGEKTPDLKETKTETKTKLVDDDVISSEREEEWNQALTDHFSEKPPEEEKEKSSAKKEKIMPVLNMAIEHVGETAIWRHACEHHKINEFERESLFKIFYEQKEDHYKIMFPTWAEMAKNFYHWIPIHKGKGELQSLLKPPKSAKNSERGVPVAIEKFTQNKMRGT